MNFVFLVGRLGDASVLDLPLESNHGLLLLEVPRRGPGGFEEPGVVDVPIVLPPAIAPTVLSRFERGHLVSVVGLLDIDVDYSESRPRSWPAVIAERVDALA